MKKTAVLALVIVVFFGVGFSLGQRWRLAENPVSLHFEYDKKSGLITAYTFYVDSKGREVKHGSSYELDTSGRIDVRQRFDHGKVVGGLGKFN